MNNPILCPIMIYFNLNWDTKHLITWEAIVTLDCKTDLKCSCVSRKISTAPFIGNFVEVLSFTCMWCHSFIKSLESYDPNIVIFSAKYMGFSATVSFIRTSVAYSYSNSWHISSCSGISPLPGLSLQPYLG